MWIIIVVVAWLILGTVVGVALGRIVRHRDRQTPRDAAQQPPALRAVAGPCVDPSRPTDVPRQTGAARTPPDLP